jgi:hypothetical protein
MKSFYAITGAVAILVLSGLLAGCESTRGGAVAVSAKVIPTLPPLDSATIAAAREANPSADPRVLVIFTKPEEFIDIRDRVAPSEKGENEILAGFREFITKRAPIYLPGGDSLYIDFINIKLAGVYPVGAIGNLNHRTILDSTPPMFMFSWAVTDRSGKIVKSAWEKLDEQNFKDLFRSADPGDPFRYEKAVLDDWMRNHIGN